MTDKTEAERLAEPPSIANLKKIAASNSTTALRNGLCAAIKWVQCLEMSLKFERAASFRDQVAELEAERDRLSAEVEALRADAGRYRWLKDLKCNSLHLERDGDHACNYMTASEWIDTQPEWFVDDDPIEVEKMRQTGTIWKLQIYPNTPVGFNVWNASTLDAAIDAAAKDKP